MNILPQLKRTPLKRSKKPLRKRRATPIGRLKVRLDVAFSSLVMARDHLLLCISCRKAPATQNGHFMRRGFQATRWHPQNGNGQCFRCNCVESGNQLEYADALEEKYGPGTALKLRKLAITSWKPSREALEALLATARIGHEAYQETWNFYGSEAG